MLSRRTRVSAAGDINGDGRDDLVWNNVPTANNRTFVGISMAEGGFDILQPFVDHPEPQEWMFYDVYLADVTGDGRSDLIWND